MSILVAKAQWRHNCLHACIKTFGENVINVYLLGSTYWLLTTAEVQKIYTAVPKLRVPVCLQLVRQDVLISAFTMTCM